MKRYLPTRWLATFVATSLPRPTVPPTPTRLKNQSFSHRQKTRKHSFGFAASSLPPFEDTQRILLHNVTMRVPFLLVILTAVALCSTFTHASPTLKEGDVIVQSLGGHLFVGDSRAIANLFPAIDNEARARYMGDVPKSLEVRFC